MGFRDTLKFNPDKYARHLKDSSDHQLKKKHHQKCLEITTCEVSMGVGLGVAPHTLGISLVSSAYAFRQAIVLNEQKDLIEEECRSRNIPVPRERKRDVGIGLAVGVGTMGLGVAVPIGLDSLSGQAIAGAASTASIACSGVVHHLCPHAAGLANAASHGGHGVVHGIKETLTSQSHHLANHGTVGTSELYGTFQQLPSGVAGVNAGVLGTMKMEGFVGSQAGGNILASAGRKIATPHY
jgi:hypothetical protein